MPFYCSIALGHQSVTWLRLRHTLSFYAGLRIATAFCEFLSALAKKVSYYGNERTTAAAAMGPVRNGRQRL